MFIQQEFRPKRILYLLFALALSLSCSITTPKAIQTPGSQDGSDDSADALEAPGEVYNTVCKHGFHGAFGGEFVEELLAVIVEIGLAFRADNVAAGQEAVLE